MKKIILVLCLLVINIAYGKSYENNSNVLDDLIPRLAMYTNYQEDVSLLNGIKDKTWISNKWIYTYRIKDGVGLFRINTVFNETGIEKIGKYTLGQGTIIFVNTKKYTTPEERLVFVGGETELGVTTCLIDSVSSKQMLISNPTCKQKWINEIYNKEIHLIFKSKTHLIQNQMNNIYETHKTAETISIEISELIANSTAIISMYKAGGGNKVKELAKYLLTRITDILIFLFHKGEVYDENSMKAVWLEGLATTITNVIVTAITSGTDPISGIEAILTNSTQIIDITNNLNGAYYLDDLTEQYNELKIGKSYLDLYYKYGGVYENGVDANGRVALYFGSPNNSSLSNTIDAVGKAMNYKNDFWGTTYNIDRIENFVEYIKKIVIPLKVEQCLKDGCIEYYTK